MKTHKVTAGIFKGHEFNGTEMMIAGKPRVWDNDSLGRSYEWKNVHRFRSTESQLQFKHQNNKP